MTTLRLSLPCLTACACLLSCAEAPRQAPQAALPQTTAPAASQPTPTPELGPAPRPASALPCGLSNPLPELGARVFSADGGSFAVALGSKIRLFDTKDWTVRTTLEVGRTPRELRLTEDGRFVVGGGTLEVPGVDAMFFVVDTQSPEQRLTREVGQTLEARDIPIYALAPDSSWIALAALGARAVNEEDVPAPHGVELFSLPKLKLLARLEVPSKANRLPRPTWRPRNPAPPSASLPSSVRYSQVPDTPPDWTLDDGSAQPRISEMVASADSRRLLVSWNPADTQAPLSTVINARSGKLVTTLVGAQPKLSPSGRWAALQRPSGAVTLYDLKAQRGRIFYDPLCQTEGIPMLPSFSADEQQVVFGGSVFRLCLVATQTARLTRLLPPTPFTHGPMEDEGMMWPGAWTSDGGSLLVGTGAGGMLELVDAKTGVATPLPDGSRAENPAPSSDSVSGGVVRRESDKSLFVFGPNGFPAVELVGPSIKPFAVAPGSEDDYVNAVSSPDGELFIRARGSAPQVRSSRDLSLKASLQQVDSEQLRFDPSGRFVYVYEGAHAQVWRVEDGVRVLNIAGCEK